MAMRVLVGFAMGAETVEVAYLTDLTETSDQDAWIFLQMDIQRVGALIGPIIGGYCAPFGFAFICKVLSGISVMNLVLGLLFFTEPKKLRFEHAAESEPLVSTSLASRAFGSLREPGARLLWLVSFLDAFALAVSDGPEAYYVIEKFGFTERDLGHFFMTFAACGLLAGRFIAPRFQGFQSKWVCASLSLCAAVTMPLMLHVRLAWPPYVYAVVLSTCMSAVEVTFDTSLLKDIYPTAHQHKAAMYSIHSALISAGFMLGQPIGGALFEWSDKGLPYLVSAVLFMCSACAYAALPGATATPSGGAPLLTIAEEPCGDDTGISRVLTHLANECHLPNKRLAAGLNGDRARRVLFVDDDAYSKVKKETDGCRGDYRASSFDAVGDRPSGEDQDDEHTDRYRAASERMDVAY